MSIHSINSTFVRCNCDTRPTHSSRRHAPPPPQRGLNFFFSCIIGKPEEQKLAQMMNRLTSKP